MKKTLTLRLTNILSLSTILLTLLLTLGSKQASAQAGFTSFGYPAGTSQTLTVCQDAISTSIDVPLTVYDPATGVTETWTVVTAPSHGSLSLASSVASSTGGNVTPSGWTYTPTGGFSGTDVYAIQVSNGTDVATTTFSVTINPLPSVSPITGVLHECIGLNTTLANATAGGTWFVSDASIATITSGGTVTGLTAGTVTIIYSVTDGTTGCTNAAFATDTVLTIPSVPAITGSTAVCVGSTTTLSDALSGGNWSSSNIASASVDASSGTVFGASAGAVTISYSVTNSCGTGRATTAMTVETGTVAAIAPASAVSVCIGSTTTLTDATAGGTWGSVDPSIATVNPATGVVTGVATGTVTIVYTVTNSCGTHSQTKSVDVITIPAAPPAISGTTSACVGSTSTLSNTTSGGTWSSANTAIATVHPTTGVVTGTGGGTTTITYTVTNTCGSNFITTSFTTNTVPATPGAITGPTSLCVGSTTTMTDASGGGIWTSTNTSVATIDPGTGVVNGLAIGTTVISYTRTNSCGSSAAVINDTVTNVPTAPAAISGATTVCVGANITLTDATAGGTWSSVTPGVATISAGGVVHGVSTGSTLISYTVTNFCGTSSATSTITVNDVPTAPGTPSGASSVCVGSTTIFTDGSTGGAWSSSNNAVASINASGTAFGVSTGTVNISYTLTNGCGSTSSTASLTVTTVPSVAAITGTLAICTGSTSTLSDVTSGGTWTSGTPSVASIDGSGVVYGLTAGSSIITYAVTNGCGTTNRTATVTVTAPPSTPASISGATQVCVGSSTSLSDATGGGTWSTSNAAIASVNATGNVTGVAVGSATITYTSTNFCGSAFVTQPMTVLIAPAVAAISGANSVCVGASITLTDVTTGGSWTTTNASIASVDGSGNVYGVSVGSANISYSVTNICGTGSRGKTITVGTIPAVPPAIGGPAATCVGVPTTETNATGGGAWSTSNAAIASINAGTGVVAALTGGTVTFTYTVTNTCGSNFITRAFTVNTTPVLGAISGTSPMCTGTNTTFTDTTAGGAWSTSNPAIASVNAATGNVTALAVGSCNINYTKANGCGSSSVSFALAVTTVPGLPAAITGANSVCTGATITLASTTGGGTWVSGNTAIATVDAGGIVTGVSGGSVNISYTVSNSCGSSAPRTKTITVNTPPVVAAIGGTTTICAGTFTILTDATAAGVWTSSNTAVASVNAGSGRVDALTAGTTTISYTVTNGCGSTSATRTFTVTTVPATPPAITGTTSVCVSSTTALADSTTGGAWSTSASGVASVNAATGVVTGVSGGSATITYTVTNSCGSTFVTTTVTVNTVPASPAAITGATQVCAGGTTTFADATSGGVWSSSAPGVATVDASSGVITGITAGSAATISYTVSNGCGPTTVTKTITVITVPSVAAIGGSTTVCTGSTIALTDATSGGVWSTSDASIASVNATGTVTGVSGTPTGLTAVITYAVTNACGTTNATRTVTVITTPAMPSSISGADSFCLGSSTTMSDATGGGVWSSTNTGVATINASGLLTSVALGTTTISYTLTNTCGPTAAIKTVKVITTPVVAPITGPTLECVGSSITLSCTTTGGTWISSNPSVATVSTSGVVTGASVGTTVIIYSVTNICGTTIRSVNDTVINGSVSAITGATTVCVGATTTLSNATASGTWSSSNFTIATVNPSTGAVTGVAGGSVTITYSVTTACGTNTSVHSMTVNVPGVAAIAGPTVVCEASTITLTDATAGGVWTSLSTGVATIDPTSGVVTGVASGTSTIVYTLTNSCGTYQSFYSVTVNPLPHAGTISGPVVGCEASSITLTDATTGGTWSSSATGTATVNTTGTVTGVAAGPATISYSVTNSCGTDVAVYPITVNPLPVAGTITGATDVCEASSISLTDAAAGGSWTSGSPAIAGVGSATGIVTGIAAGTATISYSVTNSCGTAVATYSVTVHPLPFVAPITGVTTVCEAATTALADAISGGTWVSSNTAVASIDGSGVVYGISAGSATISYTVVSAFSCSTTETTTITVNPLPNAGTITGPTSVCEGATITLSDAAGSGSWSTSATGNANVGGSGNVNGITAGADTVYYTVTNSCGTAVASYPITINPLPHAGTLSASTAIICEGSTDTITSTIGGGTWSTASSSIASVNTSGVVTGVGAGTTTISYSVTNGCGTDVATFGITVNPLPLAGTISGTPTLCEAASLLFTETVSGGTWSTSATGNATVSGAGLVTGITAGIDTVFYTVTNSCGTAVANLRITVLPLPHAGSILGGTSVCVGAPLILTDTTTGGSWSSSSTGVATVSPSGIVTGVSAGPATISYSVTNSCGTDVAIHSISVNPLPVAGVISGPVVVCEGAGITATITGASGAGTWSSSDTTVAKIIATGDITGISAGTAIISYAVTNGCGTAYDTMNITVNPLPHAGTITGTPVVCVNANITLGTTGSVGTGTWTSTNTAIATVNAASGLVHGVAAGLDTIKYRVTNSCGVDSVMITLTVNPLPDAGIITGAGFVCATDSITLVDTFGGGTGTWTVTPGSIAVVGTGAGVIIGVSAGTAHVTYSVTNSCGTNTATHTVVVNALPNAGTISGAATVCQGANTTLTSSGTIGGTWTSTNTAIASVNSATGSVNGVAGGVDTIRYIVTTATCGSDTAFHTITVIPTPTAGTIYGPATVCVGNAITLGDTTGTTAGTWSTSAAGIASIDASGNVTGVAGGTATISYTVTTTCGTVRATYTITVIPIPSAGIISGVSTLCEGATAVFTDGAAGGTWSSSDTTIARVTSGGVVSGTSARTATISYTVTNACATVSATATITITPLPRPGTITPGSFALCQSDSTTLTDTATGGSWSTSASGIASVSVTGVVYALSGGTATISYCKTNSCGTLCATASITVNPLPVAGTITGSSTVCEAATTTLASATGTAGGTWSSSAVTIASVNASTGVVTGVAAGTATISYIVSTATCGADTATFTITVNPLPHTSAISGPSAVCTGTSITLTDTATTGSWSSSASGIASVDGAGNVYGVTPGTATISYVVTNSCGSSIATHAVTVNLTPSAGTILGATHLCPGATITLTNPTGTAGGTWSSTVTGVATINPATGALYGVATGTTTISYVYTSAAGCGTVVATRIDTVDVAPDAGTISGPSTVCLSSAISLSETATGGSWTTASAGIASVDASGVVTGMSVGSTRISYSVTNSCGTDFDTFHITVLPLPSGGTLTGATTLCVAASPITFTVIGGFGSGSWSSSAPGVASVDATTGFIYGVSGGTATITYTASTASCGSAFSTRGITILPLADPGTITGPTTVCVGATITLSDGGASGSGTWSGGSGHATVGGSTGVVTGSSAGVAIISYGVTNSCGTMYATYAVTVDPLAVAGTITGSTYVCLGSTTTLGTTGSVGTGSWSTSSSTVVTVDAGGVVSGVGVGTAVITYTASTVCSSSMAYLTMTVDPLPSAGTISGYTGAFCATDTVHLTSSVGGGSWTSVIPAIASVTASGDVIGVAGGSVRIIYTVTSAHCGSDTTSVIVSINPLPSVASITGSTDVCLGSNITLSETTTGGTWTTSSSTIASISPSGTSVTVYGSSLGTATISYSVTNTCGTTTSTLAVTVHALPNPGTISGAAIVCLGSTTTYTTSGTGGVWQSSTSSIASINSTTGVIFGASAGTATITYLASAAFCGTAFDTATITVLAPPHASIITGADTLCEGSFTLLSDSVSGGTWSSTAGGIATVSSAGYVSAIAPGTATIQYTLTNACGTDIRSHNIYVRALPHAGTITGSSSLCIGTPVTLSASIAGGTWHATNTIATVSSSGTVLGTTVAGNDTIYYVVSNVCGTDTSIKVVTVNLLPFAGLITGTQNFICQGDSILLNNVAGGGFWTTSNGAVANFSSTTTAGPSTARVVGLAPGVSTITYNFVNYCGTATDTMEVTVRPLNHCYDGVAEEVKTTDIGIYPNPAVSVLHIQAPMVINVTVVSPDGKVVIDQKATTDIDVSNLASGLYMIMIYDENNALVKASKFIKAD